ncbi:MAG: CBS domain-containing protein [Acetobacteraceae bacterium]|nr:CBS domain-containing protein [Acetobacteraceae bacterium]
MKVGEIMTRNVVSVPPEAPALSVARMLVERRISAMPVTDSWTMLLGIVSEADLIRRLSTEDREEKRGLLSSLFFDRDRAAAQFARAHGATAAEIMTKDVVTATEGMSAEHAAHLMEEHRVRRLPVVHDGLLLGIVSRADLLRALLTPAPAGETSDEAIRAAITEAMARLPWADAPFVLVDVKDGAVTLHGFCSSAEVRQGLVALAGNTRGVKAVHDSIVERRAAGLA